jgi:hypothetical protein
MVKPGCAGPLRPSPDTGPFLQDNQLPRLSGAGLLVIDWSGQRYLLSLILDYSKSQ